MAEYEAYDKTDYQTMTSTALNNKRIAKNTLLLYARMLLIMLVSLYISRIVLDALGVTDYGIYNVVGGFVTMFTVISGAMTTATQRFLSFEIGRGDGGNVKSVFSTAVIIHIALAGIVLVVAETVGLWFLNEKMNFPLERYTAVNFVYQFSVLTLIVNVISVPYNAAIIAYERMSAFAYVCIVEAALKLGIALLLTVCHDLDKLILYAALLAAVAILIRIIYGVYVGRHFPECHCTWKTNKDVAGKMFSFVSWNLIGSTAAIAKEQGVNIVLNIFFGAGVNAARGVSHQVLNAVSGFISNFQLAMNPQIVKSYAAGRKEEMFKLVFQGAKFSFMLLFLLSLPIMIEADFILSLWLVNVPPYTGIFLRLVLLTALADSMSHTVIAAMHASGKVKMYQIVNGFFLLLTLPLVYLVLKLGAEPYYALVVSLLVSVVCHFVRVAILNRLIGMPFGTYVRDVSFKALLVAVTASFIPVVLSFYLQDGFIRFLAICVVSVLSSAFFIYFLGLTPNERVFIRDKSCAVLNKMLAKL